MSNDYEITVPLLRCFIVGEHEVQKRWATATNVHGSSFTLPVLHCPQCNRIWAGARKLGTDEVTVRALDMNVWALCGPPRGASVAGWPR